MKPRRLPRRGAKIAMTSFQAEVSLDRVRPAFSSAYPAWIANRLDSRLRYDLLFVAETGGAVAVESDSELLSAVLAAVVRAGLSCSETLRAVKAEDLPSHAARIVSVNPTGGEIARLRGLARAA